MDTLTQQHSAAHSSTEGTHESAVSAVSWSAIFAGAFAAAAAALVLAAVGSGFGLASVSAWPNSGVSATTFTVMTAIWLVVVQWLASGLGGYVAGRLRTKWANTHTHEVFFRDTAHGFITWAVATIKARQAADAARKAASEASIYTALSMLVGAFIACIAAALGGQRRDLHA
jgi:hypothetical protein